MLPVVDFILSGLLLKSLDSPVLWGCDVVVNEGHTDDLN